MTQQTLLYGAFFTEPHPSLGKPSATFPTMWGRRGLLRKRAKAFYILSPELWLQAIECFCAPRKGLTFPFGEGGLSADDPKHKKESIGNLRRWWMRFLSPKKALTISRKCLLFLFLTKLRFQRFAVGGIRFAVAVEVATGDLLLRKGLLPCGVPC